MLIDTDDIIHSEYIYVKVTLKNGKVMEYKLESKDIKSIDLDIKHKEYRDSLWGSEKEKN